MERLPVLKKDMESLVQKIAPMDRKPDFDSDIENLNKLTAAEESVRSAGATIAAWQEFPEYFYYPIEGGCEGMMSKKRRYVCASTSS